MPIVEVVDTHRLMPKTAVFVAYNGSALNLHDLGPRHRSAAETNEVRHVPKLAFKGGWPEAVGKHAVPRRLRRVFIHADPEVREGPGELLDPKVLKVGGLAGVIAEALHQHGPGWLLVVVHEELERMHAITFRDHGLLAQMFASGDGVDDIHLHVTVPVGGVTLVKMWHGSDSERSWIRRRGTYHRLLYRGLRPFWGLEGHTPHPRQCDFQTFKPPKAGGLRNNAADGSPSLKPQ